MTSTTYDLLLDVAHELKEAEKFYPPFHSAHEGFAILKEEVDELWDAVRLPQGPDHATWRRQKMREEAIQISAMAIRFLKDCCTEP